MLAGTGWLECSSDGDAAAAVEATVVDGAISTPDRCSLVGEGGACLARSFKGTLEEERLDNDANHERGCGAGLESHGSGEGFVTFGSETGGPPMPSVGEDDSTRSGCSSCSSGVERSELRMGQRKNMGRALEYIHKGYSQNANIIQRGGTAYRCGLGWIESPHPFVTRDLRVPIETLKGVVLLRTHLGQ
jgi:hypothetical protein